MTVALRPGQEGLSTSHKIFDLKPEFFLSLAD
jgi:hypothetical protein